MKTSSIYVTHIVCAAVTLLYGFHWWYLTSRSDACERAWKYLLQGICSSEYVVQERTG